MSAFVPRSLAEPHTSAKRPLAVGAGVGLAAAILFLARHAAPEAPACPGLWACGNGGACGYRAPAFTIGGEALARLTQAAAAGIGLIPSSARLPIRRRGSGCSVGLPRRSASGSRRWLARMGRQRPRISFGQAGLFAAALAGLWPDAAILVLMSRDLMIADFMTYRGIAIMIARLADAGKWPLLMSATAELITQDYSWAPALAPGLALAIAWQLRGGLHVRASCPLRRAGPACARDPGVRSGASGGIAPLTLSPALSRSAGEGANPFSRKARRRTGVSHRLCGRRWPAGPDEGKGNLALSLAAVFAAFPAAMAVAARGMPDVGGLVLIVCALRLAERLARLIALPKGHDALIAPMTRRVALALALTLFAMFAFRRWYAFAAAGTAIMLAIEVSSIALHERRALPLEGRGRGRRARRPRAARAR